MGITADNIYKDKEYDGMKKVMGMRVICSDEIRRNNRARTA